MTRSRLVALLAGISVAVAAAVVGAPAAFADSSRIVRVEFVRLFETDPHLVRVRLAAYDSGGSAVPFTGVFRLTNTFSTSSYPNYAQSSEIMDTAISGDSGIAVFSVDIRHLHQNSLGANASWSLTATGDSMAFDRLGPQGPNDPTAHRTIYLQVPDDPALTIPGVAATDSIVSMGDVRSGEAVNGSWPCEEMDLTFGLPSCVVNTPTTGDEQWQKGAKLQFHWTPPRDADGQLYRRCLVWPYVNVTHWVNGELTGSSQAPQLDVPGDWSTYTLPLDSVHRVIGVDFGRSVVEWSLGCYNSSADPLVGDIHQADQVPDLPPSQPTTVTLTPDASGVTVTAAGSQQLGVAKMLGYSARLVNDAGTTVATVKLPATGSVQTSSLKRPKGASASVAHVAPGRYRVIVNAYNSVGSSYSKASKAVAVAKPLSAPARLAASRTRSGARISWAAPKHTGAGIAHYRVVVMKGTRTVLSKLLPARRHAWSIAKLARAGRFTVQVQAIAKNGASAASSRTLKP